jgi:hypothetical protein
MRRHRLGEDRNAYQTYHLIVQNQMHEIKLITPQPPPPSPDIILRVYRFSVIKLMTEIGCNQYHRYYSCTNVKNVKRIVISEGHSKFN